MEQRSFNNRQIYVALSRATSFNGLYLTGTFKYTAIKPDPSALQEYEHMRTEFPIQPLYNDGLVSSDTLTILNTRPLHRNAFDIAHDKELLNTDVLYLSETQLVPNQYKNYITEVLHQFEFCHNKCNDSFNVFRLLQVPHRNTKISSQHWYISFRVQKGAFAAFHQIITFIPQNNSCFFVTL